MMLIIANGINHPMTDYKIPVDLPHPNSDTVIRHFTHNVHTVIIVGVASDYYHY